MELVLFFYKYGHQNIRDGAKLFIRTRFYFVHCVELRSENAPYIS